MRILTIELNPKLGSIHLKTFEKNESIKLLKLLKIDLEEKYCIN